MSPSNTLSSLYMKLQKTKYVIIPFDDIRKAKNWQSRVRHQARLAGYTWRFLLSGTDIIVTE